MQFESEILLPGDDLSLQAPLVNEDGEWHLVGVECLRCGSRSFPRRAGCLACGFQAVRPVSLPSAGRLYSYTKVHVAGARSVPYVIGYVDLPGDVRLLAPLGGREECLAVDGEVRLESNGVSWCFVTAERGTGP